MATPSASSAAHVTITPDAPPSRAKAVAVPAGTPAAGIGRTLTILLFLQLRARVPVGLGPAYGM